MVGIIRRLEKYWLRRRWNGVINLFLAFGGCIPREGPRRFYYASSLPHGGVADRRYSRRSSLDKLAALAGIAGRHGGNVQSASNLKRAIDDLVGFSGTPGRILICGSLYLAGEVLRENV